MILGIGTDITAIARFRTMKQELLQRILSPEDFSRVLRFKDPAPHIAGIWAAKEALVKALDKKDLDFSAITIDHTATGKPFFTFVPEKGTLQLSISHEKDFAVAFVVWEE